MTYVEQYQKDEINPGYRRIIGRHYILIYKEENGTILILRVFNTYQNPQRLSRNIETLGLQGTLSSTRYNFLCAFNQNENPCSPSWYTLNFTGQYELSENWLATATLENITN